ncbi:MAG: GNAT family N-acetyltransferase [Actinomycetes bacterium]
MARAHVQVRDAVPDDLPDLAALWNELRERGSRQDRQGTVTDAAVLARLRQVQQDPHARLVVATANAEILGIALLVQTPCLPLFESQAVQLHYLHVMPHARRKGVGRALVAAAATWAQELGADQVIAGTSTSERESARFFARLGFGPVSVRRSASTPALLRRLGAENRSLNDDLAARRRSLARVRAAMARSARV